MLARPDQGTVCQCTKCGFMTSGINLPNSPKTHRWCPDCHSPLIHCNYCNAFTSGTISEAGIICDSCKKSVKPEALVIQP